MKRIFFTVLILLFAFVVISQPATVPGTIIAYSDPSTEVYLGSPSIAILPDGSYVASHDHFGSGINVDSSTLTSVYKSVDHGNNWEKVSDIRNLFWSNLFVLNDDLYNFGMTCRYGQMVIRKSTDGGNTWTDPVDTKSGLLSKEKQYHTAPMPMVVHKDRIYRAVEHRDPPEEWGVNYEAHVISADVDADLLNLKSWQISNPIHYNKDWKIGNAWLEGNVVITPDNELVNILRVNHTLSGGYAAQIHISDQGKKLSFDPEKDFLHFPGGCKKFSIRFDKTTNRYWTLTNYMKDVGYNPERTRNCLALVSSNDLKTWIVHEIILYHPDFVHTGFQYADWQFEGQDIIALVRTAYDDGIKKPHNCHDANYITFHRIKDFSQYVDQVISTFHNRH